MSTNISTEAINDSFGQLLHIDGGPEAAEKNVYSALGVATALKLGTVSASVGNIKFNGSTISTTNTNGSLILSPNGTGQVAIDRVLITGGSIAGISDLAIADGGTGASTAADARLNLGLGSMALQAANSVAITGGSISGVTFSGSFSGLTLLSSTTVTGVTTVNGGNLRLSGNALTSTNTNGDIALSPDNAGVVYTDNLQFDGNTISSRNTDGPINLTPNGTGSVVVSKADINGGTVDATVLGGTTPAAATGTDVRATASLGYATGAGGTVTQITSKTTGVTLNKLCGQIVTHNENMSSNTVKVFTVTNSLVGANDVVVVHRASGGTGGEYGVGVDAVAAGSFNVRIFNQGAGALAEALTLNFAVIKGVIA